MDFFKKLRQTFSSSQVVERAERLRLQSYNKLRLGHQDKEYNVVNITTAGLAFEAPANLYTVGEKIQLSIGHRENQRFDIDAEVRHFDKGFYGCKIEDRDNHFQNFVLQFFSDELKGQKASCIGSDKLNPDSEGNPAWYFYNSQYELFFVEADDRLVKFKATILDTCIEYHFKKGIHFSIVLEENSSPLEYKKSAEVAMIHTPHRSRILDAMKFIDNITSVESKYKRQITNVLQTYLIKMEKQKSA